MGKTLPTKILHLKNPTNKIKNLLRENFGFILLIIIGILVRVIFFDKIPPGLNQDEASIGYDAYALFNYGIDRNGFHNPIHLVSWGSGQNALYAYLTIPFIYFLGLTPVAIRLVNLIFGISSLFMFYFLIKKISNPKIAIWSLFFLAINPWHIMMNRWALEANIFPALFLLAVLLLVISFEKPKLLIVSFLIFGLSLYAYGPAYFAVPFFLLMTIPYLLYYQKINLKNLSLGLISFTLIAIPILLLIIVNYFKLNSIQTTLFSIPRLTGAARFITMPFGNILSNFFIFMQLLFTQNDTNIWNVIPDYGFIYLGSFVFIGWGFIKISVTFLTHPQTPKNTSETAMLSKHKFRSFNCYFLLITWFISAVLLAMIIQVNINRINIIFLPLIFFNGIGVYYIVNRWKYFLIPIIALYLFFFSLFTYNYYTDYPQKSSLVFYESLGETINYAAEHSPGNIYITPSINMPYIFVLFYQKPNPNDFRQSVKYSNPGDAFQMVESFGRYYFSLDKGKFPLIKTFVIWNQELASLDNYIKNAQVAVKRFKNFSVVMIEN